MKILTAAQTREADRLTTERFGIPGLQLMENAGASVIEFLQALDPQVAKRRVVILCGKGNNGGDGLVVARLLKRLGGNPAVFLFASRESVRGDARTNLQRWEDTSRDLRLISSVGEWEKFRDSLDTAELIVDALLGTGLNAPVEGLLARVIEDINEVSRRRHAKTKVIAVDTPSGLTSDVRDPGGPIVAADYTVTFTAPKLGQLLAPRCDCTGKLLVRTSGTPRELLDVDPQLKLHWLEPGEFRGLPLERRADSHKGDYGHALLVAGSRGKSGAAVLAATGALRVGAGLVTVATPQEVLPIVAAGLPEMMTAPLLATDAGTASLGNLDYGRFTELVKDKSVLAIGPGLSTHQETQQFVRTVVLSTQLPVVLDADGLNAFAGRAGELLKRATASLVLTPHPGEMARLLGCTTREVQANRLETALKAAAQWNALIVLKGFHTILTEPSGRAYINSTGNPGMATAGTGDVLTGILAGLTAQFGVENWEKTLGFGVYLHGLAGDIAAARVGQAPLIASDLIAAVPEAFEQVRKELERGE